MWISVADRQLGLCRDCLYQENKMQLNYELLTFLAIYTQFFLTIVLEVQTGFATSHDGGDDGDRGHGHVCFLHGDGVCIDARHGDDGAHGDAGRGRRDIFPRGNRDGDLDDVHDLSERRGLI